MKTLYGNCSDGEYVQIRKSRIEKATEQNFLLTNLAVCVSFNVDFTTAQQRERKVYDKHYCDESGKVWTSNCIKVKLSKDENFSPVNLTAKIHGLWFNSKYLKET